MQRGIKSGVHTKMELPCGSRDGQTDQVVGSFSTIPDSVMRPASHIVFMKDQTTFLLLACFFVRKEQVYFSAQKHSISYPTKLINLSWVQN